MTIPVPSSTTPAVKSNPDARFIGIEIGGTKLQLVLGDSKANILERFRATVAKDRGANGILQQIQSGLQQLTRKRKIAAVGVGFGGPVDWRTGRICCSHQIGGWSGINLRHWLARKTGAPVIIDNDANTAGLAEAVLGVGSRSNPVFYVTLGSGVGGGLVVDRKIYHGAIPGESEIGHVRLDKSGRILEKSCSGWAVDEKIRAAITAHPRSKLAKLIGKNRGGEAMHLLAAIQAGDRHATRIFDSTCEDLAFGVSHVTHLTHPEMIVLGGGLSMIGEPLRKRVQQHLQRFVMDAFAPGPEIRLASLGEDAVPRGALLLAANVI